MQSQLSEGEKDKRRERELKKAEVRARLEAEATSKTKKKGFMTPERKKKLKILLRKKAAEELKIQQEAKANERKRIIAERTGQKSNLEALGDEQLVQLAQQLQERIVRLENEKHDLEYAVKRREFEINEMASRVNEMRGKFIKPPLRRIPKYEQKIERMLLNARKEVGFMVALKSVKKEQMVETKELEKVQPEWSWKQRQQPQSHSATQN